jgi:hypothetical protein
VHHDTAAAMDHARNDFAIEAHSGEKIKLEVTQPGLASRP